MTASKCRSLNLNQNRKRSSEISIHFRRPFLDVIHRIHSQIGFASLPTQISHLNSQICLFSQQQKSSDFHHCFQPGDPREIRTPDTLIRSQVLYPAELLGHMAGVEGLKPTTYGFGDRCSINCAIPLSVITTIK